MGLLDRHEILRTVIREEEGVAYQHIQDRRGWHMEVIDCEETGGDGEKLQGLLRDLGNTPFDLSRDYMLRVHLLRLSLRVAPSLTSCLGPTTRVL